MPALDTSEPVEIDVDLGVGHVELAATDRGVASAEVTPTRIGRSGDESLAAAASVDVAAGRIRVAVPRRLNLFRDSDSVDVRIEAPVGSSVRIASAYGSIRMRGSFGGARITANYGDVSADTVGDLELTAPYGSVEIVAVTGSARLTAGHGTLRIERIDGDVRAKGSHGDLHLGAVAGTIDVSSLGGVRVDRAGADATVRSTYGAIRIHEVSGGVVRAENTYEAVEVGIPEDAAAWVDAVSGHGSVRSELASDADPGSAERTVELRLRSTWSDVLIRRAPRRV